MSMSTKAGSLTALCLAVSACIGPPPGAKDSATAPGAGVTTTAAKPNADGVLVIWDGDGAGSGAKGWADCAKKPNCKATAQPTPGVGRNGSAALKIHFEGPDWLGMGWNWFGWWPETAGTDISGYKNVKFWLRIESASPELAPDLSAVSVGLRCSNGKKDSEYVPLKPFAGEALDGNWHEVVIPISEFTKGKGAAFDPRTAWEFNVSTWSGSPREFTLYIDEIAAAP
jgi:hypothetical protein